MNSTRHSQSNELTKRSNHSVRVYQFQYFVVEKFETKKVFVASTLQDNLNNEVVFQKFFANFNSDNFTSTISFSSQQSISIQFATFHFVNSFRICQMTNHVKRICRSNIFILAFVLFSVCFFEKFRHLFQTVFRSSCLSIFVIFISLHFVVIVCRNICFN